MTNDNSESRKNQVVMENKCTILIYYKIFVQYKD
jgi:hypothetical protein